MMEQILGTIAQRGTDALFSGLRYLSKSADVKCIQHVPYGELERQTLDIYLPDDENIKYTVVFIHGGSWQMGNKDQYAFIGNALAKRHIATVVINYRLFPQASYPDFIHDAGKALSWLETSGSYYGLTKAPLFLMGHSAGAHIALLSVLDESFSDHHGYSVDPIKGVICLAGVYSFRPENSKIFQKIFPLEVSGDNYAQTKPLNFVKADGTPLYILHGRNDKTVACRSAERMYKNALLAGHPVNLEVRENYGHVELLFEFVDYWPNHQRHMQSLERFMEDCCL